MKKYILFSKRLSSKTSKLESIKEFGKYSHALSAMETDCKDLKEQLKRIGSTNLCELNGYQECFIGRNPFNGWLLQIKIV